MGNSNSRHTAARSQKPWVSGRGFAQRRATSSKNSIHCIGRACTIHTYPVGLPTNHTIKRKPKTLQTSNLYTLNWLITNSHSHCLNKSIQHTSTCKLYWIQFRVFHCPHNKNTPTPPAFYIIILSTARFIGLNVLISDRPSEKNSASWHPFNLSDPLRNRATATHYKLYQWS